MSSPSVAVVVPVHKATLSAFEQLSLRSLRRHLSGYPIISIVPAGLNPFPGDLPVREFPAECFKGRHKYSQLLVSPRFYSAFEEFTYILIYQLDCLVFDDQLRSWCERGYDYVGAPWVRKNESGALEFAGVGNGGFSLRRVRACLDVLRVRDSGWHWPDPLARAARFSKRVTRYAARGARALLRGDADRFVRRSRHAVSEAALEAEPTYRNEDLFWAQAPNLMPSFRIPPPDVAVSFAFETEPRFCFERNGEKLPFGCHQWDRYDPAFWEPYLRIATGA